MAITKKGALAVTAKLDETANLIQANATALGIPVKYAKDFAYRCDLLAGLVEKNAGLQRDKAGKLITALTGGDEPQQPGKFDPEVIGEEKGGPLEQEPDEPYMNAEFTQQEQRELRESVEGGEIGPDKTKDEEQAPRAGIQASLELGQAAQAIQNNSKNASGELANAMRDMGNALLSLQANVLTGKAPVEKAAKVIEGCNRILPHVASADAATAPKLVRMASIVTKLANA